MSLPDFDYHSLERGLQGRTDRASLSEENLHGLPDLSEVTKFSNLDANHIPPSALGQNIVLSSVVHPIFSNPARAASLPVVSCNDSSLASGRIMQKFSSVIRAEASGGVIDFKHTFKSEVHPREGA